MRQNEIIKDFEVISVEHLNKHELFLVRGPEYHVTGVASWPTLPILPTHMGTFLRQSFRERQETHGLPPVFPAHNLSMSP